MDSALKSNVTRRSTWVRALYMLLFLLIYSLAEIVLAVVVLFQFAFTLFAGKPNQQLLGFGQGLSTFLYQVLVYFTYNTEDKPFPFSPWPTGDQHAGDVSSGAADAASKGSEQDSATPAT